MRPAAAVALLASFIALPACSSATGSSRVLPGASGGSGGSGGLVGLGGAGGNVDVDGGGGGGGGPASGCAAATKFVYVIDANNTLYKFDPSIASPQAFTAVGPMGCSAGAGPNSMSVGRDGYAYVLYGTDGPLGGYNCAGIYKVDITSAACQGKTPFICGSANFQKFGMGFTSVSTGSTQDALYLGNSLTPALGRVDLASGQVTGISTLPGAAEFTGNANGELWGFFPGQSPPAVLRIDKSKGSVLKSLPLAGLPAVGTGGYAYAFAFWGGAFYIFYQVDSISSSSDVWKLLPDGSLTKYIPDTGMRIVGAGVSTCAPVTPPH